MSPSVLDRAVGVIADARAGLPADRALREALARTPHRSAPGERREISAAVFAYFRWWRWVDGEKSPRAEVEAALRLQQRFSRDPAAVKPETLAARAVPEWIREEIAWPDLAEGAKRPTPAELAWLRHLQSGPSLWLRAKSGTAAAVAARLGHCAPEPRAPDALRYNGTTDLYTSAAFQAGDFEIQDLASQLVGVACGPRPGEAWWDACAGEGGKTMHLADLMRNRGSLWASDRSERRLAKLRERAARARVFNYRAAPWDGGPRLPTKGKFDGILVDAPCSGVGTWGRNPHARWTTQPADVRELAAVQAKLLAHAAPALKPGGRLVYAVCTLTRAETAAVAEAFTAAHPELVPAAVFGDRAGAGAPVFLWPHETGANGMFLAAWRRPA